MRKLCDMGRVSVHVIEPIADVFVLVYAVYGWTGAYVGSAEAARTDALLERIFADMDLQEAGPRLIVGDLNGDVEAFPVLAQHVATSAVIDVGAVASQYGSVASDFTCKGPTAKKATRRDFVFANADAMSLIRHFEVDHQSGLPVHDVLRVDFRDEVPAREYDQAVLPRSLRDVFMAVMKDVFGASNIEREQAKEAAARQHDKAFHCEVLLQPDEEQSDDVVPVFPQGSAAMSAEDRKLVVEHREECVAEDEEHMQDAQANKFTAEQWHDQLSALHEIMDAGLLAHADKLNAARDSRDMDAFMLCLSRCIEQAVITHAQMTAEAAARCTGRGATNVVTKKVKLATRFNEDTGSVESDALDRTTRKMLRQYRRLEAIKHCTRLINIGERQPVDAKHLWNLRLEVGRNIEAFVRNVGDDTELKQIREYLLQRHPSPVGDLAALAKAAEHVKVRYTRLREAALMMRRSTFKRRFGQGKDVHKRVSTILKCGTPMPLGFLKRPTQISPDKPAGSFTTCPREIDSILHGVWSQITDGNAADLNALTDRFCEKYSDYMVRAPEFQVEPICPQKLKACLMANSGSAGGLDGWAAADFTLFSDLAVERLAQFLNCIEEGASWPRAMVETRAVFLSKDADDIGNPLAYRILKITSAVYRKWASTRLRDLADWVDAWDDEGLNAGVRGKGAMDGWYRTALELELHKVQGSRIAGASIDVYKCFDQLVRQLVFRVAREAGMPARILDPYMRYLEAMQIRYQLNGTLGPPHQDRCSLPQGCPFSMAMVSLVMIPWIRKMRRMTVRPRCLADDLLLVAAGPGHAQRLEDALEASLEFFEDIGAKVADNKCFTFAADQATRARFKQRAWGPSGGHIPVKNHFRDLGTHLNVSSAKVATTVNRRFLVARQMAQRLRWMPLSQVQKEHYVRANILPAALYGAEAADVSKASMRGLRSAIARAIGPRSGRRSVSLTYSCTRASRDLDPAVQIVVNRVLAVRRIMAKHMGKFGMVRLIIREYSKLAAFACDRDVGGDMSCAVHGPVGLLMRDLRRLGAKLHEDLRITQDGEAVLDLWHLPWQHLPRAIEDLAVRYRTREEAGRRQHAVGLLELDTDIMRKAIAKLGATERNVLAHVATGGAWGQDRLADLGRSAGHCELCGKEHVDVEHVYWHCVVVHRHRRHRRLVDLPPHLLPRPLRHGLVMGMHGRIDATFWGAKYSEVAEAPLSFLPLLGLGSTSFERNVADARQILLEDALVDRKVGLPYPMARQNFRLAKANSAPPQFTMPAACAQNPPERPNVYSDGSWLFPLEQFLGLGGAGTFWPARTLEGQPPSTAEMELGYVKQDARGLMMFTALGGFGGSSTRSELGAGIVAIAADGPVHIGTDSAAFLRKAEALRTAMLAGRRVNTCWQLQVDGDLWRHFYQAMVAKGPAAIAFTKVKGHASDDHVRSGQVAPADKFGNDAADEAADEGAAVHGEDLLKIARIYSERHKQYAELAHAIHVHIIEAHLIRSALVERAAARNATRRAAEAKVKRYHYEPTTTTVAYSTALPSAHFDLVGHISDYPKLCAKVVAAHDYQRFMERLTVLPIEERGVGTTWLELYVLYRMTGGQRPIPAPECKAKTGGSMAMQIRRFQTDFRAVACRVLQGTPQAEMLKPAPPLEKPLVGLAVEGYLSMIKCRVVLLPETKQRLEDHVLRLVHNLSAKKAEQFRSGTGLKRMRTVDLRGRTAWEDVIATEEKHMLPPMAVPHRATGPTAASPPFRLSCPKCGADVKSTRSAFSSRVRDLGRRVRCRACACTSESRRWKCPCDRHWHLCPDHSRPLPLAPPSAGPSRAARRGAGSAEALGAPQQKRPRSEVIYLSGVPSTLDIRSRLSPALRARLGLL